MLAWKAGGHAVWESEQVDCSQQKKGNTSISWKLVEKPGTESTWLFGENLKERKALCSNVSNKHIKVLTDNTSAVGAINNMGSSKSRSLNYYVKLIWDWTISRGNWLMAAHIPGVFNVEADEESRSNESKIEWKLDSEAFKYVMEELKFEPDIDLFASRINTQLPRFAAYRPDPEAETINAFSIQWTNLKFYASPPPPPFSCMGRVLQNIALDKATGIIVAPDWPDQHWYHTLSDAIISYIILPPRRHLLHLPNNPTMKHEGGFNVGTRFVNRWDFRQRQGLNQCILDYDYSGIIQQPH